MATESQARFNEIAIPGESDIDIAPPACRLPPEILAIIFICNADEYYNTSDASGIIQTKAPSWVNVSYVCRHWRDVALNCPNLWTYHFLVSLRWTEELLARSQRASLKIRIMFQLLGFRGLRSRLVELLEDHSEHIRDLCLDLPDDHPDEILSTLSAVVRAPCLQHLQITSWSRPSKCSSVLFGGDTPNLRTLQLMYCSLPWDLFKLSSLTTLHLQHLPLDVQSKRGVEEFLAILSGMPDLRHIYLDRALASAAGFLSSSAFSTFQKIDLPRLSRLSIAAPVSTVAALLTCIHIPSKTSVVIDCNCERDSDRALLCSALVQRYRTSEHHAPPIRSLLIKYPWYGGSILTFGASERDCSLDLLSPYRDKWDERFRLRIAVNWEKLLMTMDGDGLTSDICCSVPLENVENIYVIDPPFSFAHWRRMLECLPNLRRLQLTRGSVPDLASVLTWEDGNNLGGHATSGRKFNSRLVPLLEKLELNYMTFSPEDDDQEDNSSVSSEPAITQRCLLDALSTRHNAPQGRLIMVGCRIGDNKVSKVVRWNGVVQSVGENEPEENEFDDD